jgi:hypothetical protein
MLSCKESTHLMSAGQDRSLDLRERFALKLHLLICKGCANYKQQMDFIRQACTRRNTDEKEQEK